MRAAASLAEITFASPAWILARRRSISRAVRIDLAARLSSNRFAACAVFVAAVFALPLAVWAPAASVLAWGASLAVETALIAAIALFFSMALAQLVPVLAATAGLYVLARTMPTIRLISAGPLAEDSPVQMAARWIVDGLALLLPPLDTMTRTEWLVYGPPSARAYVLALAGAIVYGTLIAAAGLFDFHRRNL